MSAQAYLRALEAAKSIDVSALLPQISVPTFVVVDQTNVLAVPDAGRALASAIPGAQFVSVRGPRRATNAVIEFITAASAPQAPSPGGGTRTVLFTDLVGHTEMMQRLGDALGREVLRDHERITREALKKYAGTEIKTDGDSFMVSFASVAAAVECSIELQRAFTRYSETGERLVVRMGLNAGEPIEEDGDLFGATVILASRIAAKADGGEILVADTVRGLCSGKGFLFADRGEFVAKGIEEPVRVYEVSWRNDL